MEDWQTILQRPGMSVLATFLTGTMNHLRSQLENPTVTPSYDKVCEVRGEMRGVRKVTQYIKSEFNRAAKGDTPEKEK